MAKTDTTHGRQLEETAEDKAGLQPWSTEHRRRLEEPAEDKAGVKPWSSKERRHLEDAAAEETAKRSSRLEPGCRTSEGHRPIPQRMGTAEP